MDNFIPAPAKDQYKVVILGTAFVVWAGSIDEAVKKAEAIEAQIIPATAEKKSKYQVAAYVKD